MESNSSKVRNGIICEVKNVVLNMKWEGGNMKG